jgi:hypothetical protein
LALFVIAKGRDDHLAAAYPMLYAAGAVQMERWLASVRRLSSAILRSSIWIALLTGAAIAAALRLSFAPTRRGSKLQPGEWRFA